MRRESRRLMGDAAFSGSSMNPGPRNIAQRFASSLEPFANDFNRSREAKVKYWPTGFSEAQQDFIEVRAIGEGHWNDKGVPKRDEAPRAEHRQTAPRNEVLEVRNLTARRSLKGEADPLGVEDSRLR
jgi:hypothetical protein